MISKNTKKRCLIVVVILMLSISLWSEEADSTIAETPQITFMEFGSTTCVPCKMMEKVMQEIEIIYADTVKVQFIDVTKERKKAIEYGIKLIPTQIFYNENGEEIYRHQGYFPTNEIQKIIEPHIKK